MDGARKCCICGLIEGWLGREEGKMGKGKGEYEERGWLRKPTAKNRHGYEGFDTVHSVTKVSNLLTDRLITAHGTIRVLGLY